MTQPQPQQKPLPWPLRPPAGVDVTKWETVSILDPLKPPITTVTALGRLEPVGEVINVVPSASAPAGAQLRLLRLLVEEGDAVEAGQLLAEMDLLPRLSRTVDEAEAQVAIGQIQLQVAIARQRSDLESQRARVASAEAKLRTAAAEENR